MLNRNRAKVIELRKQHPYFTLEEIGKEVHLTRERVRQILKSENIRTTGEFERRRVKGFEPLYSFNPYVSSGSCK